MKIKEIMTHAVEIVHPNDSLQMVAQKMRDKDIGFLPVYEGDQLIGVVTDRDLALRVLAAGINLNGILGRDIVTAPAICCFEDQDVEEAARLMHQNQIRRLVILAHRDNRPMGVVSLGDLVGIVDDKMLCKVMQSVSASVKTP